MRTMTTVLAVAAVLILPTSVETGIASSILSYASVRFFHKLVESINLILKNQ
jgi:hypothetical protein